MPKHYPTPARYGTLRKDFRRHYSFFNTMINRCRIHHIECDFHYSKESFSKFIEIMGPVPLNMKAPSVGRFNHTKGYIFDIIENRWNFRWQERSDNSRELALRTINSTINNRKKGLIALLAYSSEEYTCPHCLTKIKGLHNAKKYHFDNCEKTIKEKHDRKRRLELDKLSVFLNTLYISPPKSRLELLQRVSVYRKASK